MRVKHGMGGFYYRDSCSRALAMLPIIKLKLNNNLTEVLSACIEMLYLYSARHEDRLCLLRRTASATKCPPVRKSVPMSVLQLLVSCDVSCSDAAGLRKRQPRRHPAVSAQATSVGDELHCSAAGVLVVAVRPCQPTSTPTALVEGKGAN